MCPDFHVEIEKHQQRAVEVPHLLTLLFVISIQPEASCPYTASMSTLRSLLCLGFTLASGGAFLVKPDVSCRRNIVAVKMAMTPVGPFCPFRSAAAVDIEPRMESLNSMGPQFATEMARLQLDMQMGQTPDKDRLLTVADDLDAAVSDWENLVTRLRLSQDFQTREYAKLTQAHLDNHGETVENIASVMRWQAGCMRAMANQTPPPMPPPGIDLQKMMEQANDKDRPSITAMTAAEQITATPFTGNEPAFESPTVKEEYEKLCRDHVSLIEFGSKYDGFDPLGKLYYLDEIEKVEERWDVFFARFSLMGALNKQYIRQCNNFLAGMGMNEEDYRKLLKKCHQMMRDDADAERNRLGL